MSDLYISLLLRLLICFSTVSCHTWIQFHVFSKPNEVESESRTALEGRRLN